MTYADELHITLGGKSYCMCNCVRRTVHAPMCILHTEG